MTPGQIDNLGSIIDAAANYEALSAMPPPVACQGMGHGLRDLAHRLRALYVELAGNDPWEGDPTFPKTPD